MYAAKRWQSPINCFGGNTFKDVGRNHVDNNAVLVTDTHLSYQGQSFEYAAHLTLNHSQQEYKSGLACTNGVEGFFSQ